MIDPMSFISSRSTEVITACLIFIIFMERATFSGSSHSKVSGRPVLTPQKPQDLVQIFPKIINVAVPSPQHSPIFGQLAEEQIVLRLYLSTKLLNSVYFFPVGSFTRIHFGLGPMLEGAFDFSRISVLIIKSKVRKIQTINSWFI